MTIFVDADSCPVRVREIICKAACRIKRCAVFAANRPIPLPKAPFVRMAVTDTAEQAADAYILQNAAKGDLAVTRDIPLAKLLVDKGITVINDRGTCFTEDNIDSLVSARNFMYELQGNGRIFRCKRNSKIRRLSGHSSFKTDAANCRLGRRHPHSLKALIPQICALDISKSIFYNYQAYSKTVKCPRRKK